MVPNLGLVRSTLIQLWLFVFVRNVLGFMDIEELKSVYYGLDILNEPVVLNKDLPVGAVQVTSKYGQHYQCRFPDHNEEEKRKEEEEKIALETGIVEMLKPLGHKDCLFKSKDWWSYEFCYGKFIRQFHMEDGEIKGNVIYLGHFESDFDWTNETAKEERLSTRGTMNRYHSQRYTLGTKCDLTAQPRRAEVRFICEENSEDYLARVDEAETCVYTVVVMTSRICRHPYLRAPAKRRPVAISCHPALAQEEFEQYTLDKEEEKQRQAELKAAKEKYNQKLGADESSAVDPVLEREMSTEAKHLLAQPVVEELFSQHLSGEGMPKDLFEKTFGQNKKLWHLYQRSLEISNQRQEKMELLPPGTGAQHIGQSSHQDESPDSPKGQGSNPPDADSTDQSGPPPPTHKQGSDTGEDEKVLAEFDQEIQSLKKEFAQSHSELSSVRTKLALEKSWETELESAIKEAENELGVKVDRSLISGLSNTLDKLVNKLHDTQAELNSMDKELGHIDGKDKDKEEVEENNDKEKTDDDDDDDNGDMSKITTVEDATSDSAVQSDKEVPASHGQEDLDDKIQAPPKSRGDRDPIQPVDKPGPADSKGEEFRPGAPTPQDKGEITATVKITLTNHNEAENYEDGDKKTEGKKSEDKLQLPANVQKLLEESVRKEYERQKTGSDSGDVSFASDHSFQRDKSVHVIQQEDKDGKTNRFIFVFGFDTFNDESVEEERQSTMEENYSFVYSGKKDKKSSQPIS